MAKYPKVPCKNCGFPTTFPDNCDGRRERLGWCPACFKNRNSTDRDDMRERRGLFSTRGLHEGNYYNSSGVEIDPEA